MAFCLLPEKVDAFKKALKAKDIRIADLLNMESEARTKLLEEYAGPNAKDVNRAFEEKLVLKNQLQGIKNWASKLGEVGRYDPRKKAEIDRMTSEFRAKQQERIFSPAERQSFLNDVVEEKFGTRIAREEAKEVFRGTMKSEELLKEYDSESRSWSSDEARYAYGASKVALENYVEELKTGPKQGLKGTLREALASQRSQFRQDAKENVPRAALRLGASVLRKVSDTAISTAASLDNSFLGRQGLKTLMTHPTSWWKGAKGSFVDIAKELGGREAKEALMADIYSRPNYLDGSYRTADIIARSEEQFPTSLPAKIPGFGRLFKASEAAFEGSALRMRTDLYDLLSEKLSGNGLDMKESGNVRSLGKLINSLTARGKLGKFGESPVIKLLLWAPRMLKANWDVLTLHTGQELAPFARREAAINLVKLVGTTAAVLAVSNALKPGSVEWDPRSSDFGKLRFGDTRFDVTGGAASLITLAARQLSGSSKSSTSDVVKPFGSKFGETSRFDSLIDFLANKTTPPVRVLVDILRGENARGQKPGFANEAASGLPITLQNALQAKDHPSADAVAGVLLDALGISANTYAPSETDWSQSDTDEMTGFREKVGDKRLQEANDRYNDQVSAFLGKPEYAALSNDGKQEALDKERARAKAAVFKEYGYRPKR